MLEVERIHQQCEKAKLDLEGYSLSMIRDGLLSSEGQDMQVPRSDGNALDINNLRLLPQFNERMTDAFFVLFEHVSKARSWSDVDCALMLQCALTGKSQEAYSFMKAKDSFSYAKIKSAVQGLWTCA